MILAQLPGNGTGNYETRVRRKKPNYAAPRQFTAEFTSIRGYLLMNQTLISAFELTIHLDDPSKCKKEHKANGLARKEREKQFPS